MKHSHHKEVGTWLKNIWYGMQIIKRWVTQMFIDGCREEGTEVDKAGIGYIILHVYMSQGKT